jgi:hypothetical protein
MKAKRARRVAGALQFVSRLGTTGCSEAAPQRDKNMPPKECGGRRAGEALSPLI